METSLIKKLLKFIIPLLTIPILLMLIFYHNYLISTIKNGTFSVTANIVTQMNSIIQTTQMQESDLSSLIVEGTHANYPTLTIISKDFYILGAEDKKSISKRYVFQNEDVEKYFKGCLVNASATIYHNKQQRLLIKPILDNEGDVFAFTIGSYKTFFQNKVVTINQTFIYILFVVLFVAFISIIVTIIFSYHITHPIMQLIDATKTIANGDIYHKIKIESNDEVGILVGSFNDMIQKQKVMNEELKEQQVFMIHQSRLAQMGEIISMIAHQWRQPLHSLAFLIQTFSYKYEKGKLNATLMREFEHNTNKQIQNMSKSISEFRNFFKPHNEKVDYFVNDTINTSIDMLNPTFTKYNLFIKFENNTKFSSYGYPNELAQALINILNNAKDALLTKEIKNKEIKVTLEQIAGEIVISVFDNAGGIPQDIISKIFDPYFSTKDKNHGTGLGLYMSKLIIQDHMHGDIKVFNTEVGACFKIYLQGER